MRLPTITESKTTQPIGGRVAQPTTSRGLARPRRPGRSPSTAWEMKKGPVEPGPSQCPRGDLNPHALIRALAPQASASANSATRTSAGERSNGAADPQHRGGRPTVPDGRMGPCRASARRRPVLRPRRRGRRPVPRADPDRHHELRRRRRAGGAQGRRVRRRRCSTRSASSPALRARAGPHVAGRALGRRRPGATPLLLHGHLDVVPAAAEDWQVDPFSRRDPGRLRLGPRRGRHEGLRRDAAVGRPGARPGRRGCRTRPIVLCFTADEEAGGHNGRRGARRATTPTSSRTAPRRSARSAASAPPSAAGGST